MKPNYLTLILSVAVVLVVIVGVYLFLSKRNTYAPAVTQETTVSEIQSNKDLSEANKELDSSDLDSVDSFLDQIDSQL